MKKQLLLILITILSINTQAQTTDTEFFCRDGSVHFFSATLLENIEAKNNNAIAVLNTSKNTVQVKIPIKKFAFEKQLMEEHFNENYLESDKYPYGSFTGNVVETVDWTKPGTFKITVKGVLDIHGVKQTRNIICVVTIADDGIKVKADFEVKLVDHKIKIPKVVVLNIAEIIKVDLNFNLTKKQ